MTALLGRDYRPWAGTLDPTKKVAWPSSCATRFGPPDVEGLGAEECRGSGWDEGLQEGQRIRRQDMVQMSPWPAASQEAGRVCGP